MTNMIPTYRRADASLPKTYRRWHLFGAGLENLGDLSGPSQVPMPEIGPNELLVRHDACGLCFSDIKVIRLGEDHPRIYRHMREDPVVLGHEIAMTVVRVGEDLQEEYRPGDRFTIQADIYVDGVGYAYGYEIQGGLSQYNVIDQRVLNGDGGNYLIPVQPSTGYAESALTEPWACVTAAYELTYRTNLQPGGTTWIIGRHANTQHTYALGAGMEAVAHPARLLLTDVPDYLGDWLAQRAQALGMEIIPAPDLAKPPVTPVDDIVLLGATPELVETVSPHLADFGIVALIEDRPLSRPVQVDIGRVHYNRWLYVGSASPDIASAYSDMPVRSTLRPKGQAWFVGAGGPMGRMHVQRAIQLAQGPRTILCTDISDVRLKDLEDSFGPEARAKGVELLCFNPSERAHYQQGMARFRETGFDDIVVMAPVPAVIEEASSYLSPEGMMNIFAGVARGTKAALDLSALASKDVRFFGHSASSIEDLRLMLRQAEDGVLSPNRSVAAIGSLSAAKDGLKAVQDAAFPGKVVIFPQIKDFPLTALPDLKEVLPSVYARLHNGREWTNEAEEEFLRLLLA
jgi:threonine dehydrogenase-like Zn-dependent dehydrogenase